jgi:hypothetical protein
VDSFFVAFETQQLHMLKEVFAEKGRQLNPYAPEGFPKALTARRPSINNTGALPKTLAR